VAARLRRRGPGAGRRPLVRRGDRPPDRRPRAAARPGQQHLQAFKVGINKPRSRGDRDEPSGGRGASWKGAFVGGDLLVEAVTTGATDGRLFGNFPDYNRYPT
jgi:hypothetical protein